MAKVLICGYYGFGNLGDEALLSGLLSGLKDQHDITVLSGNPDATENLHEVKAVHRYKSLFSAILNCDAVISGGGGLLQNKTSNRSLFYYLAVLRIAKLFKKKTFVFGQSIGPLNEQGQAWLKSSLKGVNVAVRDKSSQDLLASLDIKSECFADCALLLKNETVPTTTTLPASNTSAPTEQKPIMLIPRGGYPVMESGLLAIAEQLQNRSEDVIALTIQKDEDQATIDKLIEIIPSLKVYEATTPYEVLKVMEHARLVISIRLHGLILAAKAGVPIMGIVYDPKVAAFLDEANAVEIILPVTTTLDLDQTLSVTAIEALSNKANAGIDWLNQHLNS